MKASARTALVKSAAPSFPGRGAAPGRASSSRSGEGGARGSKRKRRTPADAEPGFLNRARVKTQTTKDTYREAVDQFEKFCGERRLRTKTIPQVDAALEARIEDLFKRGENGFAGRCVLYGWLYYNHSRVPGGAARPSDHFPLARGALHGWEKLEPNKTIDPAPWEASLALADWLLNKGELEAAMYIPLAFDSYWRPSEGLALVREHILRPAKAIAKKYSRWGICFCPQEELKTTKTNVQDDSVLIGVAGREWVADVLKK